MSSKSKRVHNWDNRFWSESHHIPKLEQHKLDSWFYSNIFSPDQYEFKLDFFNQQKTLFKRKLFGDSLPEPLFYPKENSYVLSPQMIDNKLRNLILKFNYQKEVYWFSCYQGHTYKHDLTGFGLYSFEDAETPKPDNGKLAPVFNNLINPKIGHDISTNYRLYSGLLAKNKKWMFLISFESETDRLIRIKVAGENEFCKLF